MLEIALRSTSRPAFAAVYARVGLSVVHQSSTRGLKLLANKTSIKQVADAYVDEKTNTVYTKPTFPHPVATKQQMENIEIAHRDPGTIRDKYAFFLVKLLRFGFDLFTGYKHPKNFEMLNEMSTNDPELNEELQKCHISEEKWLLRVIFLESIAGVPGMVGAFIRHLHSIRLLKRDKAWIESLCEEAYNERMHLLTFIKLGQPSIFTRAFIYVAQGVFVNLFFLSYLTTPKTCHRFVGYLEEEAVATYTHLLKELQAGGLPKLENATVPDIALAYWKMPADSSFEDLILYIRADEAKHREVNHTLANLNFKKDRNPYAFQVGDKQPSLDLSQPKPTGWDRNEIKMLS